MKNLVLVDKGRLQNQSGVKILEVVVVATTLGDTLVELQLLYMGLTLHTNSSSSRSIVHFIENHCFLTYLDLKT